MIFLKMRLCMSFFMSKNFRAELPRQSLATSCTILRGDSILSMTSSASNGAPYPTNCMSHHLSCVPCAWCDHLGHLQTAFFN